MDQIDNKIKFKLEIIVYLDGGNSIKGRIFASENERILDVMNDGRQFIPIENANGIVVLINKDKIVSVEPSSQKGMQSGQQEAWWSNLANT